MANMVLVHGAWHGAWCWEETVDALRARGHVVRAIDLPGSGEDSTPVGEVTLQGYAEAVVRAVESLPGRCWLVGHSMGGIAISQAAEHAPERLEGSIYVAAFMPQDGQSLADLVTQDAGSLVSGAMVVDGSGMASTIAADRVREVFYGDCTDAQVSAAQQRLGAQPLPPLATPLSLSAKNYGRVPRYYVECRRDRAVTPEFQRRMQAAVGVEGAHELDTDHSPFYSAVPQLVGALEAFARARA